MASNFYRIQLSRFPLDFAYTGKARELSATENTRSSPNQVITNFARQGLGVDFEDKDNAFSTVPAESVFFDVSPTMGESRSVDYADQGLPGPSGIVVYKVTQNRRFTISSRFVSRTLLEAQNTYRYTNLLRSWLIPHSEGSINGRTGRPPVLRLYGYKNQFYNIPVVISELTINYPEDVDYIEHPDAMVPIIQSVDLSLIETHGRTKVNVSEETISRVAEGDFDLAKFKDGKLVGY